MKDERLNRTLAELRRVIRIAGTHNDHIQVNRSLALDALRKLAKDARQNALEDAHAECSKVWQQIWECHQDAQHPEVRAAGRCEEAIAELIAAGEKNHGL